MRAEDQYLEEICSRIYVDLGDGTTEKKLNRFESIVQREIALNPHISTRLRKRDFRFVVSAAAALLTLSLLLFWVLKNDVMVKDVPFWVVFNGRSHGTPDNVIRTKAGETARVEFGGGSQILIKENTFVTEYTEILVLSGKATISKI